jgi:hypothetical protein
LLGMHRRELGTSKAHFSAHGCQAL